MLQGRIKMELKFKNTGRSPFSKSTFKSAYRVFTWNRERRRPFEIHLPYMEGADEPLQQVSVQQPLYSGEAMC